MTEEQRSKRFAGKRWLHFGRKLPATIWHAIFTHQFNRGPLQLLFCARCRHTAGRVSRKKFYSTWKGYQEESGSIDLHHCRDDANVTGASKSWTVAAPGQHYLIAPMAIFYADIHLS
jgi:hypothetical protein